MGKAGKFGELNSRWYSDEQREFILAMGRLKERLGRLPTPREVLQEALRLGYRKTERITLRSALKALRG